MKRKNKRAQEEMVGFALIMIVVAVILLVFLGFSLNQPQKELVESYEAESFIQAVLQYTTDCRDLGNLEYLSIKKLIFNCNSEKKCLDEKEACEVLNSVLIDVLEESWDVGINEPIKGYKLNITVNEMEMLSVEKGNVTSNYKGAMQDFVKSENSFEVYFTAYY